MVLLAIVNLLETMAGLFQARCSPDPVLCRSRGVFLSLATSRAKVGYVLAALIFLAHSYVQAPGEWGKGVGERKR